jgi:hypothetical protein
MITPQINIAKNEFTIGETHHQLENPINNNILNTLKAKILAYSAIKINANNPEEYSILKPETNSDSPSAKSNGARLVSANKVTTQTKNNGGKQTTNQTLLLYKNEKNLIPPIIKRPHKKKRAILIS